MDLHVNSSGVAAKFDQLAVVARRVGNYRYLVRKVMDDGTPCGPCIPLQEVQIKKLHSALEECSVFDLDSA